MISQNHTAVILCGGRGERLRPLTESIPKPLVNIAGKPILKYLMDHLVSFGVKRFNIAAGYEGDKIVDFFRSHYLDYSVSVSNIGEADILQRILACGESISSDFSVYYGDTLANIDLNDLYAAHCSCGNMGTVALYPLTSEFGLCKVDANNKVQSFTEKPTLDYWINIGYFFYQRSALGEMKKYATHAEYLAAACNNGLLQGYRHNGVHITVNTLRELEEAESNISRFDVWR